MHSKCGRHHAVVLSPDLRSSLFSLSNMKKRIYHQSYNISNMILHLKPTIKLIKMIPFIIQGNYIKMGLSRSLVPEDQHVPYDSALSLKRLFNQRLHLQLFITQTNCIMACVSTLGQHPLFVQQLSSCLIDH